jgi:hypothetical protein
VCEGELGRGVEVGREKKLDGTFCRPERLLLQLKISQKVSLSMTTFFQISADWKMYSLISKFSFLCSINRLYLNNVCPARSSFYRPSVFLHD